MNIIVLGPQGSGKGTQAAKLAQEFGAEHIDMGKYLREVAALDTPLGKEIWHIQNVTRTLVPKRILEEVLNLKLSGIAREKNIVFDGVPRKLDQMDYLEETMRETGRQIDAVVYIKLSEDESFTRISKRMICNECKKVFILGKDIRDEKEKCPVCGGEIIQRADDTREGVATRLKVFKKETMPVIESYRKQKKLIEIDGAQSIEKVFSDILEKLKEE